MHAIVIPGNGRVTADGSSYELSPRCVAALQLASRLAVERPPRAVIFSGWSPVGGVTEAEQMRDAWEGPDGVELVLEPNAHPAGRAFQEAMFADGLPVATFAVADVHGEYERLRAEGVVFRKAPTQMGPVVIAVLDDTCGNVVQLLGT